MVAGVSPFSRAVCWWCASLALILFFSVSRAHAAELVLSEKPTPLLAGHLLLKLPEVAKSEPRGHSLMSADEADADETRVVIDQGSSRMVLMGQEIYGFAPDDLGEAIRATGNKGAEDLAPFVPVEVPAPLQALQILPPAKGDQEANLILRAWIKNADRSVQVLSFYINPDAAKDTQPWVALAQKIVATVQAGPRKLAAGGEQTITLVDMVIKITLPPNWAVSRQNGIDFDVLKFRQLANLGASAPTLGIYVGNAPSMFHEGREDSPKAVKRESIKLFGSTVPWFVWSAGENGFVCEGLRKLPKLRPVMHLFGNAPAEADLTTIRKIAESISVTPPPKAAPPVPAPKKKTR